MHSNTSSILRGIFFSVVAAISQSQVSFMSHFAEVQYALPSPTVLLIRGSISSLLALLTLGVRKKLSSVFVPRKLLLPVVLRGLFGTISIYLFMVCVTYIPAGTANTISSIQPMLAAIASALLFGEKFTIVHFVSLIINYLGVALVVFQPIGAMGSEMGLRHPHKNPQISSDKAVNIGSFYAILSGVLSVCSMLPLKYIGNRVDSPVFSLWIGVFSYFLFATIASPSDLHAVLENHRAVLISIVGDVFGFINQNAMALALRDVDAGTYTVVCTLNVPISYAMGYVFMHELITPSQFIGALLVIASIICSTKFQFMGSTESPESQNNLNIEQERLLPA